jgi:hypothetical protein
LATAVIGSHVVSERWRKLPSRAVAFAWFGVALLLLGRLWLTDPTSCH